MPDVPDSVRFVYARQAPNPFNWYTQDDYEGCLLTWDPPSEDVVAYVVFRTSEGLDEDCAYDLLQGYLDDVADRVDIPHPVTALVDDGMHDRNRYLVLGRTADGDYVAIARVRADKLTPASDLEALQPFAWWSNPTGLPRGKEPRRLDYLSVRPGADSGFTWEYPDHIPDVEAYVLIVSRQPISPHTGNEADIAEFRAVLRGELGGAYRIEPFVNAVVDDVTVADRYWNFALLACDGRGGRRQIELRHADGRFRAGRPFRYLSGRAEWGIGREIMEDGFTSWQRRALSASQARPEAVEPPPDEPSGDEAAASSGSAALPERHGGDDERSYGSGDLSGDERPYGSEDLAFRERPDDERPFGSGDLAFRDQPDDGRPYGSGDLAVRDQPDDGRPYGSGDLAFRDHPDDEQPFGSVDLAFRDHPDLPAQDAFDGVTPSTPPSAASFGADPSFLGVRLFWADDRPGPMVALRANHLPPAEDVPGLLRGDLPLPDGCDRLAFDAPPGCELNDVECHDRHWYVVARRRGDDVVAVDDLRARALFRLATGDCDLYWHAGGPLRDRLLHSVEQEMCRRRRDQPALEIGSHDVQNAVAIELYRFKERVVWADASPETIADFHALQRGEPSPLGERLRIPCVVKGFRDDVSPDGVRFYVAAAVVDADGNRFGVPVFNLGGDTGEGWPLLSALLTGERATVVETPEVEPALVQPDPAPPATAQAAPLPLPPPPRRTSEPDDELEAFEAAFDLLAADAALAPQGTAQPVADELVPELPDHDRDAILESLPPVSREPSSPPLASHHDESPDDSGLSAPHDGRAVDLDDDEGAVLDALGFGGFAEEQDLAELPADATPAEGFLLPFGVEDQPLPVDAEQLGASDDLDLAGGGIDATPADGFLLPIGLSDEDADVLAAEDGSSEVFVAEDEHAVVVAERQASGQAPALEDDLPDGSVGYVPPDQDERRDDALFATSDQPIPDSSDSPVQPDELPSPEFADDVPSDDARLSGERPIAPDLRSVTLRIPEDATPSEPLVGVADVVTTTGTFEPVRPRTPVDGARALPDVNLADDEESADERGNTTAPPFRTGAMPVISGPDARSGVAPSVADLPSPGAVGARDVADRRVAAEVAAARAALAAHPPQLDDARAALAKARAIWPDNVRIAAFERAHALVLGPGPQAPDA